MAQVYLARIPELNNDYRHVMSFPSLSAQSTFLMGRTFLTKTVNFKPDAFLNEIVVQGRYEEISSVDYLFFNVNGKNYCYFVNEVQYNTSDTTKLIVSLDVYMTYQFDFEIISAFVERCHVDRWESVGIPNTTQRQDNNLNGEIVLKKVTDLDVSTSDGTYIYATSTPIGVMGGSGGGGNGEGVLPPIESTGNVVASNGDKYSYPTNGTITAITPTYPNSNESHYGIDIANNEGTPIRSPYNGEVSRKVDGNTGYGKFVVIKMDNQGNGTSYHLFGHMNQFHSISVGDRVEKGSIIGYMGSTGNSTGNHVHWEISANGTFNTPNYINPSIYAKVGDKV